MLLPFWLIIIIHYVSVFPKSWKHVMNILKI